MHLVDAPLECVVLGAGHCIEAYDVPEGDVHRSSPLAEAALARRSPRENPAIDGRLSARVRGGGGAGSVEEVFGDLADLPVAVILGSFESSVDLGTFERREGDDRTAAHCGLVCGRSKHSGQPGRVADRAERCDRGLAHEGVGVIGCERREASDDRRPLSRTALAERPRRGLDDDCIAAPP